MSLPTTRRIVTGHNAQGRSIIESDQVLTPANPVDPEGKPPTGIIPGFTNLFRTDGVPAKVQGPWSEVHGKKIGLVAPDGVYSRIVDFPPTGDADDKVNIMHRTQSVDFGVVLKGSIQLVLEDGVETTVGEGEVVVQRGTNHAWKNITNENARMLFVLVPSVPIINESTGQEFELTPTTHLEEDPK
ncbi:hypothetical protein B0A52_05884 [Exophiala mesophila]|uniref:Cupin type-2 domain-containing protein n=1 Tax=Exophiala mesophila TaxID=212818 RepID=A0A438N3Q0_EXOME|nr:hypothetical protein B0A52_05884 [Exophiala mesophila]